METSKRLPQNKHLPQGLGVKSYVPYQNINSTSLTNSAQAGSSGQQNTFTPGQTQTQGNLGSLWQSFMGGNIPSSFTTPQAPMNAFTSNYNQNIAPGVASTYGAGSPVNASNEALQMQQMQGNLYNTGVQNYNNALNSGTNYALSPTGQTGQTAGQGQTAQDQSQTSGINPLAFLANMLGQLPQPSDERLKKNIKPLDKEKAVEQIKKLRSVEFSWREEANDDKRLQLGFIAQEVEQVIPEAVSNAADADNTYLLDKGTIIPVLVAAVQELTERLERLEKGG